MICLLNYHNNILSNFVSSPASIHAYIAIINAYIIIILRPLLLYIPVAGVISVMPRAAAITLQLVAPCCCARASCSPAARRRTTKDFIFYLITTQAAWRS